MRGDGVESFAAATALDAALDACLFEADETVLESLDPTRGGAEYVPAAAASSLPNELVASVRAAALALAENTASDSSEANLAAVSRARATRGVGRASRAAVARGAGDADAGNAHRRHRRSLHFRVRPRRRLVRLRVAVRVSLPASSVDGASRCARRGDGRRRRRARRRRRDGVPFEDGTHVRRRGRSAAGSRRRRRETPELASLRVSRSPSSRRRSPRRRAGGPPRRWRVVCRPRTRASSPCCSRRESTAPPPRPR